MAAFNKFNCFVQDLANGRHDMKTGTAHVFRVYLSNTAPTAATDASYNSPPEIAAGNGYTVFGPSIGVITGAQVGGVFKFTGATDPTWTAAGGSIGPFRYAIVYNASPVGTPLIGWWDYGVPITLTNGNTFTVDLDQVNGILTIT